MNLKRSFVSAAVAAMLFSPAAYSAPQIATGTGTGAAGPVNLNLVANVGVVPTIGVAKTVTGTALYMSEIANQGATFPDANVGAPYLGTMLGSALDLQTTIGAGIAQNAQAAFRIDLVGGTFGTVVTAADLTVVTYDSVQTVANIAIANTAAIGALNGVGGPLLVGTATLADGVTIITIATVNAIIAAANAAAVDNSAASELAAIAAAKVVLQGGVALSAAQQAAIAGALTGTITAVPNVTIKVQAPAVTVQVGGSVGSNFVIFQVDTTGALFNSGVALAVAQSDVVDFRIGSIKAAAVPANVVYEYHMFGGGNGVATATQNNRGAAIAAANGIAINTSPSQVTSINPNATNAVIDIAQSSMKFVPNTRQVLKGDAGLQIGSLGVAATSAVPVAPVVRADGQNTVPNVANVGALNNYPGTVVASTAQYTGVSTEISRSGATGAYNTSVVGAIITQVVPGSPNLGNVTVTHAKSLDPNGVVYGVGSAAANVDTVSLTITSADPAGFSAFTTTPVTKGRVFLDMNADGLWNAGDVTATAVTANTAIFAALTPAQAASGANVTLTEDGKIVMAPSTFTVAVQYSFGSGSFAAGTFNNPAAVTGAFGATVKNGSTAVADSIPESNNAQGKVGFIRVTNRSNKAGAVSMIVYDKSGAVVASGVVTPSLAPQATWTIGTGFVGGAGAEIDKLAGTPGVASFVGRARAVISGEFTKMDVQSTVSSPAGVPVQTNLSAHGGQ